MKSSLSVKFILGCLAVMILSFLFVTFLMPNITTNYLTHEEEDRLYDHAQTIRENYETNSGMDSEELLQYLSTYGKGLSAEIWITDQEGTILLSSAWNSVEESIPTEFNPLDFSGYSMTGDFYGMFEEETISVYIPLSSEFRTLGYVLIHEPSSAVKSLRDLTVNMTFLAAVTTFLLSFLILFLIYFFSIHRPVKKITKVVAKYAKGDLNYKADIKTHDEFGYLAAGLNDMSDRLNQAEDDQKKFLANISHDFRSPLTSIKGYIEAIKDGTIPPEYQDKYLQTVLDETNRLTKLTENMLELNTLEQGTLLNYSVFDINDAIRKVLASFEGTCREKGITFDMIQSDHTLFVRADFDKIQQVLYNLIDNAIKFSHQNGVIEIETEPRHELAFISIKDHGVGIPRKDLSKIWERFYKTDASRGRDRKGTGLGLSIVKEIIEAHGMTIDVISTEGVGTEFIFRLPLAEEETD